MNTKGEDVNACLQVLPWYFQQEDQDLQTGCSNHHIGGLAWITVWRSVWATCVWGQLMLFQTLEIFCKLQMYVPKVLREEHNYCLQGYTLLLITFTSHYISSCFLLLYFHVFSYERRASLDNSECDVISSQRPNSASQWVCQPSFLTEI